MTNSMESGSLNNESRKENSGEMSEEIRALTKDEKLSNQATKLIEDARLMFSTEPKKAIEHLMSVDPKSLSLYDRQKIGREILARIRNSDFVSIGDKPFFYGDDKEKFIHELSEEYQIRNSVDPTGRSFDDLTYEERKKMKIRGKYVEFARLNKIGDEQLKVAEQFEEKKYYKLSLREYIWAGDTYLKAQKIDDALYCYRRALDYIENSDKYENTEKEYIPDGHVDTWEELRALSPSLNARIIKAETLKSEIENRKLEAGMKDEN
jgi:hypothetical protein